MTLRTKFLIIVGILYMISDAWTDITKEECFIHPKPNGTWESQQIPVRLPFKLTFNLMRKWERFLIFLINPSTPASHLDFIVEDGAVVVSASTGRNIYLGERNDFPMTWFEGTNEVIFTKHSTYLRLQIQDGNQIDVCLVINHLEGLTGVKSVSFYLRGGSVFLCPSLMVDDGSLYKIASYKLGDDGNKHHTNESMTGMTKKEEQGTQTSQGRGEELRSQTSEEIEEQGSQYYQDTEEQLPRTSQNTESIFPTYDSTSLPEQQDIADFLSTTTSTSSDEEAQFPTEYINSQSSVTKNGDYSSEVLENNSTDSVQVPTQSYEHLETVEVLGSFYTQSLRPSYTSQESQSSVLTAYEGNPCSIACFEQVQQMKIVIVCLLLVIVSLVCGFCIYIYKQSNHITILENRGQNILTTSTEKEPEDISVSIKIADEISTEIAFEEVTSPMKISPRITPQKASIVFLTSEPKKLPRNLRRDLRSVENLLEASNTTRKSRFSLQ